MSVKCNEKHFSTFTENSKGEFSCSVFSQLVNKSSKCVAFIITEAAKDRHFTEIPYQKTNIKQYNEKIYIIITHYYLAMLA